MYVYPVGSAPRCDASTHQTTLGTVAPLVAGMTVAFVQHRVTDTGTTVSNGTCVRAAELRHRQAAGTW